MKKILIANRGEIALRVIRTCQDMGIKTVTLYTPEEKDLPHAFAGDENICLGEGSLSETYLNIEKIVGICQCLGVDGVHPGYGFLSERPAFAKALSEAGIKLIGPPVAAMEAMGDKKTSKVVMEKAGIPLIPGYHGDNQEDDFLKKEALKIGFPVLIKASAGGGGKGMRIVESEEQFIDALMAAKREALNAFGDDKVLIEKFITSPRHIEVQVMSDGAGNHFHFFERECSIQRRYQKIIEESPSPALSAELRQSICETAVKIAAVMDYEGAGTVEFILDTDGKFYFLEMNTRLQVEHPITEMVTGSDLVALQIMAARGETFDFEQWEVEQVGHAIECRLYAEDPDQNFLPSTGTISVVGQPRGDDTRLDTGYNDGNEVTISFDPMLAKLITYGSDREQARTLMLESLREVPFLGVKTNSSYLSRVLRHESFIEGATYTHFVQTHSESLGKKKLSSLEKARVITAFYLGERVWREDAGAKAWGHIAGFRLSENHSVRELSIDGETVSCQYHMDPRGVVSIHIGDERFECLDFVWGEHDARFSFSSLGEKVTAWFDGACVCVNGESFNVAEARFTKRLKGASHDDGGLTSPMPGKILKVLVSQGQSVAAGDNLIIMEAMKMEHTIKAPHGGTVTKINCKEGSLVDGGVALCDVIDASDAKDANA